MNDSSEIGVTPPGIFGLYNPINYLSPILSWGVCVHAGEMQGSDENLTRTLDNLKELGARYIRTDFIAEEFKPYSWSEWDINTIKWYHKFINEAKKRGIQVIMILNFKSDGWYEKIYKNVGAKSFFNVWREYCEKMAREFGRDVYYYQILNEENGVFTSNDKIKRDDEPSVFATAYQALRKYDNNFKTIVNVLTDYAVSGDIARLKYWCNNAGQYIDVLAIDHYPGTWGGPLGWENYMGTWEVVSDWNILDDLMSICVEYNKEGAIMETGFSTFDSEDHTEKKHTEDDQEIFVNYALPVIRDKVLAHNTAHPNSRIILACWYELRNAKDGEYVNDNKENNFGILYNDWTKKMAYGDLMNRIATFGNYFG